MPTWASPHLSTSPYPHLHPPLMAFSHPHLQGGMVIMLLLSVAITVLSVINVGKSIMFIMTPHLWATSSLMPFIGFLLGYILSAVFRLNGQ